MTTLIRFLVPAVVLLVGAASADDVLFDEAKLPGAPNVTTDLSLLKKGFTFISGRHAENGKRVIWLVEATLDSSDEAVKSFKRAHLQFADGNKVAFFREPFWVSVNMNGERIHELEFSKWSKGERFYLCVEKIDATTLKGAAAAKAMIPK